MFNISVETTTKGTKYDDHPHYAQHNIELPVMNNLNQATTSLVGEYNLNRRRKLPVKSIVIVFVSSFLFQILGL